MSVESNFYDDTALAKMRADQEDPWVQYIIINIDLGMDAGKIAAQVGHGCDMHIFRYFELKALEDVNWQEESHRSKIENTKHWIEESLRKIVKVAHQKEFDKAKELDGFDCFLVKDAGLTQVAAGSETVLVFWPIKKSTCPKLIHKLQLLKGNAKNE